ncbi:signal transduction histidine kinase [Arthrobacter pigmenti]|uniref:histidine kinase n=1 Tax=Arthrobacter pigmenti TaxID=271432 RepID=A0A846RME1_9MICC|nr:histidine kinase [Arthrobacter pigmenti]NJC20995.1 signal transduction histidine kinase [Arthrobacter pigmenti]
MNFSMRAVRRLGAILLGAMFFFVWSARAIPTYTEFEQAVPGVLSALLLAVAIALSERFPLHALTAAGLLLLSQFYWPFIFTAADDTYTYGGFGLVFFFMGNSSCSRVRMVGLAGATLFASLASGLYTSRYSANFWWSPTFLELLDGWLAGFIRFSIVMLGIWLAGFLLRMLGDRKGFLAERAKADQELRAAEVELNLERERGRISQELHDVLAHSLAVISMQADGARYASEGLTSPVRTSLEEIAKAARHALVEAQLVIDGVGDDLPQRQQQPGVADLSELVTRMRTAGLRLDFTDDGNHRKLTEAQELSIYRIIQESLTNTIRHAPGADVTVGMDWSGPGLSVQIITASTSDRETGTIAPLGEGRGIAGMKNRARTAGGWLTAEPDSTGFRVTVFIPYRLVSNTYLEPMASSMDHA